MFWGNWGNSIVWEASLPEVVEVVDVVVEPVQWERQI